MSDNEHSQLGAAAEAFLRGASMGTSDVAESKLGSLLGLENLSPESIQARAAANPWTSGIGEVAGGILPYAGAAAATAAALPAAGAAGVATLAGGLYGATEAAGKAGSQAILENRPLAAEHLAWDMLKGGALGAVLGRVGHAIGEGVSSLAEKFSPEALSETASEYASKALKPDLKYAKNTVLNDTFGNAGRAALDDSLLSMDTVDAAKAARELVKQRGAQLGAYRTGSVDAAPLADELSKIITPNSDSITKPVGQKQLLTLLDKVQNAETISADALKTWKGELGNLIDKASRKGGSYPELIQVKDLINKALDSTVSAENQSTYAALQAQYGPTKDAAKFLLNNAAKETKSAGFKLEGLGLTQAFNAAKDVVTNPARIARTLDAISKAADSDLAQSVSKLLSKAPEGKAAVIGSKAFMPSIKDYAVLSEHIADANQNPLRTNEYISMAITDGVHDAHRETDIADNAALNIQKALQFLDTQRPKPTFTPTLLDNQWQPPAYLKSKWLDQYRAVTNPASVAAHPTPDSLDALKQVYPEIHNQILNQLNDRLANDKSLTYSQKLQISKFLGPVTSTMTNPEFVGTMQQMYQSQQPDQGQQNSARTHAAKRARIKQIAQDEQTAFNKMQQTD